MLTHQFDVRKAISYEAFQNELSTLAAYYHATDSPTTSHQSSLSDSRAALPVGSREGASVAESRASSPPNSDASESEEADEEYDGPHDVDIVESRTKPTNIPTLIAPSHEH